MNILNKLIENPILTSAFRGKGLNWRMLSAIGLAILAYCPAITTTMPYILITIFTNPNDMFRGLDEIGATTFYVTVALLLIVVTLFAPTMAASAIAGERQRQTFDLLMITLLPTRSIVIGKFISSVIYTLLLINAVWPVILFSVITGGISFVELAGAFTILVITAIAFTMIGLFVSSIGKTTTNATMLIYGVALPSLFIAPPLLMLAVTIVLNLSVGSFSDLSETINFYGWMLVASLNPLVAAIASAIIYVDNDGILLTSTGGSDPLYTLSPGFVYVAFYAFLTWFLAKRIIVRLERMSQ
ncbi:MAG: ABC transporter permease subunit [Chloroflexota bacterium]